MEYRNGIVQYVVLGVWLLSFSIMLYTIISVACVSASFFLWPNNIPLYGWMTLCLSHLCLSHLLYDFHLLAIMNNTVMNICGQVFMWINMLSFLLGLYLGIKLLYHMVTLGFSGGTSGKELSFQFRRCKKTWFDPWVGKTPRRRAWQPTPVFLPGESHGQRSLAHYSPWGCKESDMTEAT